MITRYDILVGLVSATLLMVACQSDTFYIKGEAHHLSNGTIILLTNSLNESGIQADSIIVEDGRFCYEGSIDTPCVCRLFPAEKPEEGIVLFKEPGNIYIELSDQPTRSRVSGTVVNNRWQALNDSVAKYEFRIRDLLEPANDSINPHQHFVEIGHLYKSLTKLIKETAVKNKDNVLGRFIDNHYQDD